MLETFFSALYQCLLFGYQTLASLLASAFPSVFEALFKLEFKQRGITVDGNEAHDVVVNDPEVYKNVPAEPGLRLGERYIDGWWDFSDTEGPGSIECTTRVLSKPHFTIPNALYNLFSNFVNRQTREKALEVVEYHYNKGNELFESFLDKNMQYSCAYWRNASDLEQAQLDKMDLIARKLKLKPGMKVLELGSGFGTLAKHLAENYGVSVVAYNISVDQVEYARKVSQGLPVEFRLEDYRNASGSFDRVYSIAFLEAVGHCNFKEFFRVVNRCLKEDGLALVHSITIQNEDFPRSETFAAKFVFPNGELPYLRDLISASSKYFQVEDVHNFGYDYSKTLEAWRTRFIQAWPKLKDQYGEKFYRLWMLYLTVAAGLFKSRTCHLIQVVYSKKNGFQGTYDSER